jgi:hypothetical protein
VKRSILDKVLLILTVMLAAYQIAIGVDRMGSLPIVAYTVAFGVLLVAGLLLIILGLDVLDSPVVVIISTVIPLSLSLGLVWEYLAAERLPYLVFACLGFLAVVLTRLLPMKNSLPVAVLAVVHAVAGLIIFLLPVAWVLARRSAPGFGLVGAGGALIGVNGSLLALLKAGKPLISRQIIYHLFPGLLLLMTAAFVAGFALV